MATSKLVFVTECPSLRRRWIIVRQLPEVIEGLDEGIEYWWDCGCPVCLQARDYIAKDRSPNGLLEQFPGSPNEPTQVPDDIDRGIN